MISTAAVELKKARRQQAIARDVEWDNPDDPIAERKRVFWESEVNQLATMQPDTVIPLF